MLCPCCGDEMSVQARICDCGARIVGEPLGGPITKIQVYGPVVLAFSLFAVVVTAAAVWTLWTAVAGVVVLAAAHRATKLARQSPDSYGGYRVAVGLLLVTAVSGAVLTGFGISRIPRYLSKRADAERAQTAAAMIEYSIYLEKYRAENGGKYPPTDEDLRKFASQTLPLDSWDIPVTYNAYTEGIAEAASRQNGSPGPIAANENFELRSAGPDGKIGTDDDIVMRDGVFCSSLDVLRNPQGPRSPIRTSSPTR
ncbi:MAG TPA: hypothetical protein VFV34_03295 [Blastocatellia bacterium]|nr:hypothetical protein [Blastocatellia bacterium]